MKSSAFGYTRVSGLGQLEGDGLTRQIAAISRFVEHSENIGMVCYYAEEGVSGTLENRPALGEMLLEIEEQGIKFVIIEKLDRIARDVVIQENLIREFQRRGVTLISTMEPDLCSTDPTRILIRQILGCVAQYERAMIVLRTRAARERIRARGQKCEGRKPYGFKPGEADTLARMTVMSAEGYNWSAIARELNQSGIKSRSGRQWFPAAVGRILRRALSENGMESAWSPSQCCSPSAQLGD